ncbi:hypothetical protein J6590_018511 [Homalodisca vitripennis]|nr:hypothetical protein J6590_018511 [Homalodisca vitripennis]
MLWFQQRATMPKEMATSLQLLLWMRHLGVVVALVAVFTGVLLISCSLFICLRICRMHSIQVEKEKNEANLYVAAMDYPIMDKANLNQYIVMKPKNKMDDSAKL